MVYEPPMVVTGQAIPKSCFTFCPLPNLALWLLALSLMVELRTHSPGAVGGKVGPAKSWVEGQLNGAWIEGNRGEKMTHLSLFTVLLPQAKRSSWDL